MGESFLLQETGRGGTVGATLVASGAVVAGAGAYVLANQVLLPRFTDKEIYDQHFSTVLDLKATNNDLEEAQQLLEQSDDTAGATDVQNRIDGNEASIEVAKEQYPEGYSPFAADIAGGGSAIFAGVVAFTALKHVYRKYERKHRAC